jgi:AmmeMemoRadiSam system protein B
MISGIIPHLRSDIKGDVYEEDGKEYILLSDPYGYASQPVSLPFEFSGYFSFLDGKTDVGKIKSDLENEYSDDEVTEFLESFHDLVNFLDYMCYLDTPRFHWIKQDVDNYLFSSVRPAYCSGSSYSDEPDTLRIELNEIFSSVNQNDIKSGAELIIVPHIDFRIGENAHKAYASGYHALRENTPDLIVIFGTSHYGSSKRFILTEKNFETPLGIAITATDIIDKLRDNFTDNDDLIIDDISHRHEHSIEFQVLLSQHYFGNPNIRILPILVNSFASDIFNDRIPVDDNGFKAFVEKLKEIILLSGYTPVIISSVDMAHIGRKFGDEFDASDKLESLKNEDNKLIHHLASIKPDDFFREVAKVKDKNKICGLAPIYTALQYCKPSESRCLHYDIWHEEETKSAVSFASFAYYK